MRARKITAALAVGLGLVTLAWPCEGTRKPRCGQTAYLGQWVPETVVYPGEGQDALIPVRLAPYLLWNTDVGLCAQPTMTDISLTLELTPADGGATVTVPPQQVPTGTPPFPGQQPVLTGTGGAPLLGGTFNARIPADLLGAEPNWTIKLKGMYSVTFAGAGVGAGTITAESTAEASIVEPSPADPSIPRLNLRVMPSMGQAAGFGLYRRGDQFATDYLLENNDADHAVRITFGAWSAQVAHLPSGGAEGLSYALSSPVLGTDGVKLRLGSLLREPQVLSVGDPNEVTDNRVSQEVLIGPESLTMLRVYGRSHGMCADGSCSHIHVSARGTWMDPDGSIAEARVGSLARVASVAARTPLTEVTVEPQAGAAWETDFSRVMFGSGADDFAFGGGNTVDEQGDEVWRTQGLLVGGLNGEFPFGLRQYLRLDESPTRVETRFKAWNRSSFFVHTNRLGLRLPVDWSGTLTVPTVELLGESQTEIDVGKDSIKAYRVFQANQKVKLQFVYGGAYSTFEDDAAQDPDIDIDTANRLSITIDNEFRNGPDARLGCSGFGRAFFDAGPETVVQDFTWLAPMGPALQWTATANNPAITVVNPSGTTDEPIRLSFDVGILPAFPLTPLIDVVNVSVPGAIRPDQEITVAVRSISAQLFGPLDVTKLTGKLNLSVTDPSTDGSGSDSINLKLSHTFAAGLSLSGKQGALQLGARVFPFTLSRNGRFSGKDLVVKVKAKKKKGLLAGGTGTFKIKVRKSSLGPVLSAYGFGNEDFGKPGVKRSLPVILYFCGEFFLTAVEVDYAATANRKAKFKKPR
jgi:hypothetical protein